MINELDLFFYRDLYEKFPQAIQRPGNIISAPVDLAISSRRDQELTDDQDNVIKPKNELDLPFVSIWRDPLNTYSDFANFPLSANNRICPDPNDGSGVNITAVAFEANYTLEFWADLQQGQGDNSTNANYFNKRWLQVAQAEQTFGFDVPIDAIDDTLEFKYMMQLGNLIDNSDLARQHDHGATIRYTGEIDVYGYLYSFSGASEQRISEIALNYYVENFGEDVLTDEVTIT